MAARIPDINIIQDTPTSPNHAPRTFYTSPDSLPRVPEDGLAAPELDRHAEGLQVDPNGPYPQPTTRASEVGEKHWYAFGDAGEKQLSKDESGLIPYESSIRRRDGRICGLKRRTFIIVAVVASILLAIAAIGGGVGGYFANKSSSPKYVLSPLLLSMVSSTDKTIDQRRQPNQRLQLTQHTTGLR